MREALGRRAEPSVPKPGYHCTKDVGFSPKDHKLSLSQSWQGLSLTPHSFDHLTHICSGSGSLNQLGQYLRNAWDKCRLKVCISGFENLINAAPCTVDGSPRSSCREERSQKAGNRVYAPMKSH